MRGLPGVPAMSGAVVRRSARAGAMAAGLVASAHGWEGTAMAQATSTPPLTCSVEAQDRDAAVTLFGRIATRTAAAGRYQLEVRKIGAGGRSNIAQGGEFRSEPASTVTVGHVSIGLEQGARYEAVLTLTVEGQTYTCDAFGPGPRPL